ncbi:MAG: MoxR family ATPase, partial [Chloroflexota bacterium]
LPEAQLDRFLFKILIPYLPQKAEAEVLRRYHSGFRANDLDAVGLQPLIRPEHLPQIRSIVNDISVEDGVLNYIAAITHATRNSAELAHGASTRAGVSLLLASKTLAALRGRDYVSPDDIKTLVPPTLRHRVYLRPEAEIEGLDTDAVFRRMLSKLDVPR